MRKTKSKETMKRKKRRKTTLPPLPLVEVAAKRLSLCHGLPKIRKRYCKQK
jgi:hypothetical protein